MSRRRQTCGITAEQSFLPADLLSTGLIFFTRPCRSGCKDRVLRLTVKNLNIQSCTKWVVRSVLNHSNHKDLVDNRQGFGMIHGIGR